MRFYERVSAALQTSGVPCFLNFWRKSEEFPSIPDIYCVYYRAYKKASLCADDAPVMTSTEFNVTVFGKRDLSEAVTAIQTTLEGGGFEVLEIEDEDGVKPGDYATHLYCVAYDQV